MPDKPTLKLVQTQFTYVPATDWFAVARHIAEANEELHKLNTGGTVPVPDSGGDKP